MMAHGPLFDDRASTLGSSRVNLLTKMLAFSICHFFFGEFCPFFTPTALRPLILYFFLDTLNTLRYNSTLMVTFSSLLISRFILSFHDFSIVDLVVYLWLLHLLLIKLPILLRFLVLLSLWWNGWGVVKISNLGPPLSNSSSLGMVLKPMLPIRSIS